MHKVPVNSRNYNDALATYLEDFGISRTATILLTGKVDESVIWALQRKKFYDITYAMDRNITAESKLGADPIYALLERLSNQGNSICTFFKRFNVWYDGGEFQALNTWQEQSNYLRRVKNYLLIGGLFATLSRDNMVLSTKYSDTTELHGRLGLRFEMRAIINTSNEETTFPVEQNTLSVFQYW